MRQLVRQLVRVIRDVMSRYRHKDALRIEDTLHNRLQKLLAKHHPVITVKLHRWQRMHVHGVVWGGPFTVLVHLDTNCFCGMSFDLIGKHLVISQIHGVGLNRCRYRPMRRYWEITLVRAARDLGFRTLLIRADHADSWRDATPEVRERLVKRLDDTARALGLTSTCAYWVWGKEEDDGGAQSRVGDHMTTLLSLARAAERYIAAAFSASRRPLDDEITSEAGGTGTVNRTLTPKRRPNADLRTREYLAVAEVERLLKATKANR